jgi:chemotaxis protein MotA
MADPAQTDDPRGAAPRRPPVTRLDVPPPHRTVDFALLFGLTVAFGLVAAALMAGGTMTSFYNGPALMIVFFGTFAVTLISFTTREVLGTFVVIAHTLIPPSHDTRRACQRVLNLAAIARDNGILALEALAPALRGEPFLQRAVAMTVDGSAPELIEKVLTTEIEAVGERNLRSASVLRRAAEVAPAMGLIGTLVGLIQMLARLDDPSSIGPAMAVALLTTFYGAIMAYMVFAPIAAKLDRNSSDESLVQQIYLAGAASISRQENPRILETYLNTLLPSSKRLAYYD